MHKICKIFITIFLLNFSFFYTNKIVEIVREKDFIMKEIRKSYDKFHINSINAKIINDKIYAGKNGRTIDYNETYKKMKHFGLYNEVLTTFKEVEPSISIKNIYDKYIIGGNVNDKNVALLFKIKDDKYYNNLIDLLNDKKIHSTLFFDSSFFINHSNIFKNKMIEIEILNTDILKLKSNIDYVSDTFNRNVNFCYLEKENKDILNFCGKLKLHTVIPSLIIKKRPYRSVVENLNNGSIISFELNNSTLKELPFIIDYIKQKGYKFYTLSDLVNESLNN